jgi:hypothetical protein
VHCPGIVLGGTVHGNQFQRLILAGVVELVFCACWYDDYIAGFDVLFLSSVSVSSSLPYKSQGLESYLFLTTHNSFTLSRSKNQHLINKMNFIANISSNRNFHSDELRVKSCVDDLSELAKTADLGGQALEIDELVLWR